jgi:hypothetical protein
MEGVITAVQRRDTASLSRIYAPGYHFVIGGGDSVTTLTRAERLQAVAASGDSIPTLNLERCDFDLHGNTAVGHCWIRQRNVGGTSTGWVGIHSTGVWVRRDTRWRLVASHASVNRPRGPS